MFRKFIAAGCLLVVIAGCSKPELSEEEKKKQWGRQAARESKDHKPMDSALGAKDFAKESKDASEQNTQAAEQATKDSSD